MKVVYTECLKVFQIASVDARNELLAYLSTLRMRMIPVSRKLLMEMRMIPVTRIFSIEMRMIPVSRTFLMEMRMIPVSRKLLMEAEELVRWRQGCFPPTEQRLSGSDESAKH